MTINMTNCVFQMMMHPDHIHLMAVTTPLGLYKWLVMPIGLKNVYKRAREPTLSSYTKRQITEQFIVRLLSSIQVGP